MKSYRFISSTDYVTLKNDSKGSVSLYIGGSPALANQEKYTYEAFIDIGTANAPLRTQLRTDVAPTVIYSSPQIQITLEATISGGGGVIDLPTTAFVERISATRMRLVCTVHGVAVGLTTTVTGKFQTVTADIVTFLSPFN